MESSSREPKCYICGRTENEFFAILAASLNDKKAIELETALRQRTATISSEIKEILKATQTLDACSKIEDLDENSKRLFGKYLPDGFRWDIGGGCSNVLGWNKNVSYFRQHLTEAITELESGNPPNNIKLDEDIQSLKSDLKKVKSKNRILEELIPGPRNPKHFINYNVSLTSSSYARVSANFLLCPICEHLISHCLDHKTGVKGKRENTIDECSVNY